MLTSESVHTNTVVWKSLISPEITCVGGQLLSVSELVKKRSLMMIYRLSFFRYTEHFYENPKHLYGISVLKFLVTYQLTFIIVLS